MLSDTNFILSMKSESYDIGIADGVDTSMYGLFEILGIPRIVTTVSVPMPDGVADLLGIPLPRAYVPCAVTSVTPVVKQPMGFRDRLMNLYAHFSELVGYYRPLHRRLVRLKRLPLPQILFLEPSIFREIWTRFSEIILTFA